MLTAALPTASPTSCTCSSIRSPAEAGRASSPTTRHRTSSRSPTARHTRTASSTSPTGHRDDERDWPRLMRTPKPLRRVPGVPTTEEKRDRMTVRRMDNVGIVVDDLPATIAFFRELGLELEGQATIEGEWAGRVTGLGDQRVEIAMMRTPDGHSRLELSRFLTPPVVADHRNAPVNALGYLRVMFAVDHIDDTLARLRKHGAQLVGEVVQYENVYRLCYVRGPEGILIGLAEQIG